MTDDIQTTLAQLRDLRDAWTADQGELGRYATEIGNAFLERFAELDELLTAATDEPVIGSRDGVSWTINGQFAELELTDVGRQVVVMIEAHQDGETGIALNGRYLGAVQWAG